MPRAFGTQIVCPDMRHTGIIVAGATTVTTTSTTYVTLGSSDVAFTLPYPASGACTVHLRAGIAVSVTTLNAFAIMGFEIRDTNSSGTSRLAAHDDRALFALSKTANEAIGVNGITVPIAGLPASGTMYIRAMYRTTTGTATYSYRGLHVVPSP
jgi:hypothetical protein